MATFNVPFCNNEVRGTSFGSVNRNLVWVAPASVIPSPSMVRPSVHTTLSMHTEAFTGEMIKAYESATIAKGTVQSRQLRNGKAAQFIFTGRMSAEYHTLVCLSSVPMIAAGLGSGIPVAEKTIVMDDLLISSAFVYDLDETLAHYSLRSEISAKSVTLWLGMIRRSSVRLLWQHVKLILSLPLLVLSPVVL